MSSTCAYSPHSVITRGEEWEAMGTRPVRSDHHTLRTEGVEDDVEVGSEVLLLPILPIRLRHHAGNLHVHVRKCCQCLGFTSVSRYYANPILPLSHDVVLNEGLCDVVDDEGLFREERDELGRCLQLLGVDEDIVGQIVLLEERNTAEKVRAEKELVIRLILHLGLRIQRKPHDVAHAHELLVLRPKGQLQVREEKESHSVLHVLGTQIHPSHDTHNHILVLFSEVQEELCFFFALSCLHGNRPVHSVAAQKGAQVGGEEIPPKRLHVLIQPRKRLMITLTEGNVPRAHSSKSAGVRRFSSCSSSHDSEGDLCVRWCVKSQTVRDLFCSFTPTQGKRGRPIGRKNRFCRLDSNPYRMSHEEGYEEIGDVASQIVAVGYGLCHDH